MSEIAERQRVKRRETEGERERERETHTHTHTHTHRERERESETGRIRFRGVWFQTPSSVSFLGLTEFRGANSVSSSQPIICVPNELTEFFAELTEFAPNSVSSLLRNSTPETERERETETESGLGGFGSYGGFGRDGYLPLA